MTNRYAELILRWRYLIVILGLVCALVLAAGAKRLVFVNDYRYFFSEDNPQLLAFETLQNTYTKNDNIFIMLEPKTGDVFSREFLSSLKELTEQSWQVPHSIRVDSITNFQHTYADGDDLVVIDLVDDVENLDAKKLAYIKAVALNEPTLVHRLVSATSEAAGINITIEISEEAKHTREPEFVDFSRNMVEAFEQAHPEINVYTTGIVMLNNAFTEASIRDMQSLIPSAFLAIIIGLYLFLRNGGSTISAVIVIVLSIIMSMGAAGWLAFKLTPPSASAPTVILTLAVADCVHFLTTFLHAMRAGMGKFEAIKESLRININPIFLTSLTTAVGFLSLNFSDVPPFHDLGNITAIGVMFAFVLSIFFLPALVAILPIHTKAGVDRKTRLMSAIAEFVIANRKALLWGTGLVVVTFLALIPRNEINDRFVEYFDESVEFRRHTDYVTENISGLYTSQFSLEARFSGGISEPDYLKEIDNFADWLRAQPEVMHVNTISDTIKRLNKNMHGDDERFYTLPESRELTAQYLLLYELSLPYGLDLNNQIDIDKSSTRLSATLENLDTDQMLAFERKSHDWIKDNTTGIKVIVSSPAIIFSHLAIRNIESMMIGTLFAMMMISVILVFALKSLKLGLLSLVPNLVPIGIAFGIWAIFDGEVGLALSVVAGITLGIVVDDTVHFMSKYLRAKREKKLTTADAVRYAFENVGSALLITTIVLAGGFSVLTMSAFELNSAMGLLTAMTIVIALIVDFLFLPPLLMALDGGDNKKEKRDEKEMDEDLAAIG